MASNAVGPETSTYTAGPPLPQEMPKPPFRPQAAGTIAFFFSIVSGAIVSAVSLRRMGHSQKAKKVIWITLLGAMVVGTVIIAIPDVLGRILGFCLEIVWYFVFPRIQDQEFRQWESTHNGIAPSSGWKAVGWGFVGLAVFFAIIMIMAEVLTHALNASGIASQ